MSQPGQLSIDTVIFGGGAAGLWLLDELVRNGRNALLLEAHDLGSGQTIASQGIIHGGLKYTLSGLFTQSAKSIRDMPLLWRRCLAGEALPDLSSTRLRAEYCHLWRTDSMSSKLAMIGARAGLRIAPVKLDAEQRPAALLSCPGTVARLDEQVIDPASFLENLAGRHARRLLKIDAQHGLEFQLDSPGHVQLIRLINPSTGEPLDIAPAHVILLAGSGNELLRTQLQLSAQVMQRRPLHMVMARGALPLINGHCVDGSATRLTITSTRDFTDQVVWQIGGQIAEEGVTMQAQSLINHTKKEIRQALPDVDLTGVQWATYTVDRAEASAGGRRPEEPGLLVQGNTVTGWPTKLALVPRLIRQIVDRLPTETAETTIAADRDFILSIPAWPRPLVAAPPWETAQWNPGS